MAKLNEVAAQLMEHLCNHDWHGYDQTYRNGDGEGVCPVTVDGRTYNLQQGDRDCSSAVIECWRLALQGTGHEGKLDTATYTGNMRSVFVRSGLFVVKPLSFTTQRGDIYLNDGNHTAMCVSVTPDLLAEFSINEKGGIKGGQVGDQTGRESYIHAYYNYPWNCILHYIGNEDAGTSTDKGLSQPKYRVKTAEDGWLDWMEGLTDTGDSGDDYAGVKGHAIIDFEWKATSGSYFQLVLEDGTELGKDQHNSSGKPLSGIKLYYSTENPGATGFYKSKYRVAPIGKDYLKWEYDVEDDGAGGAGVIDRLQHLISK